VERYWARPKAEAPCPLRRGAWYPVTRSATDSVVVVVNQRRVVVPRSAVEFLDTPPRRWTVVHRPANATILPPQIWGDHYAVCPGCTHRAPLFMAPQTMACPRCGERSPVAWDGAYLARE
jgi:hypothetical protein